MHLCTNALLYRRIGEGILLQMKFKILWIILLLTVAMPARAQEKVIIANFYQVGSVPSSYDSIGQLYRLDANAWVFNFSSNSKNRFFRADLSWLMHHVVSGDDTLGNDTNLLIGYDLPVFGFTMGWNIVKGKDFNLGIGLNLDTRNYFGSAGQRYMSMFNALQTGLVISTKIKVNNRITYSGFYGYDLIVTGRKVPWNGKQSIYTSNNISYRLLGSFAINVQPDISFKSFKEEGKSKVNDFKLYNLKFGIAFLVK